MPFTWRDEIRLYLLELMEHEKSCATQDDGCPECRRAFAAYQTIRDLIWKTDVYEQQKLRATMTGPQ